MDFFATLGIALGLAMLTGINLYLTIFLTGLAMSLDKISDAGLGAALEGFGHPAVIAVALGLFIVQFIVDKIPWVDSLWDSIHTFIKPAGGVLLALTSLGSEAGGVMQFFVVILALAGSLLTHWVKAGTRLHINTSPEPFSNIGASVVEDLVVVGGALLVLHHPATALLVFAVALAGFVYLTPRVTRSIRAILWLIWRKVRVPASDRSAGKKKLPRKLKADAEALLLEEFGSEEYKIDWCVPCVTGKTTNAGKLSRNLFGELIAVQERPGTLFFFGSRNFKKFVEKISLNATLATHESRFLCEEVVVHNRKEKRRIDFRFHRGQEELAERITDELQARIPKTADRRDHDTLDRTPTTSPADPEQKLPGIENDEAPEPENNEDSTESSSSDSTGSLGVSP